MDPNDDIRSANVNYQGRSMDQLPSILLLDTSASMAGRPIAELNRALLQLNYKLAIDSVTKRRVEAAIITFGPVSVVSGFRTSDSYLPPILRASGDRPIGAAIEQALAMLQQQTDYNRLHGIKSRRPAIFLMTNGMPTDSLTVAARLVHAGEKAGSFAFFAIGAEGANNSILEKITVRRLRTIKWRDYGILFKNIFNYLRHVCLCKPGEEDKVYLADPRSIKSHNNDGEELWTRGASSPNRVNDRVGSRARPVPFFNPEIQGFRGHK